MNSYNWRCAPPNAGACSAVQWHERILPDLAFQDPPWCAGECGDIVPWEHILLAANELGSHVWINVPVTATSPTVCRTDPDGDHTACIDEAPELTYEYQLAMLFAHGNNHTGNVGLKPGLKLYVEHSNEVSTQPQLSPPSLTRRRPGA